MRCAKATRQLQLYIDHQLTLKQLRELELHISGCSACHEELRSLEALETELKSLEMVIEPEHLTSDIMRRVARTPQCVERPAREVVDTPFPPSLVEVLCAALLATVAMLGVIIEQLSMRGVLSIADGHDELSHFFVGLWSSIISINSNTLMLGLWVVGTVLGVWITLLVAGAEMRNLWLKSVVDRLTAW
ncbi:MAG TPA: zf-HC2 domain-containing protein [Ktedonobacteraceae bacterium]|nr:zf-HC2 domain-containing protein [Ktedonobacteraceae bacterium]